MTEQKIFVREPGRLGIRIPRSAWKAAGHSASTAMRQKGTLVSQGQLSDWVVDDMRQVDDELICYGPGFDGLSLEELFNKGLDEATLLQRLAAAARALHRLETSLPSGIQSAGILVAADGDVLVLPPALVSRAAARTQSGEGPTPESNPAIAASVLLAGTLRRLYLSKVSVDTDSASKAGDRRKGDPFVPLGLIAPSLYPKLAILADRAMDQITSSPSLADWARAYDEAGKNKYQRKLSTEELANLELQLKAAETKVGKRLSRKRFITKRGGFLAALAITAVVIASIAIFDRPPPGPDLSELGPEALVQAYYEAIDTLDLASLEACLEGKVGKEDRSLVTNLSVVLKMRQAYARDTLFISAGEWIAAGSPELEDGALMYGLSNLEIRSLALPPPGNPADGSSAAGQAVPPAQSSFEAKYTLWTTGSSEDSIRGIHTSRIDQLLLTKGKKGWKIIAIERESL